MYSKLTINVGGMFSGKTTELLRQGKRHTLANDEVIYIKPDIDNRYSNTKIVSHTGEASDYTKSIVLGTNESILRRETMEADVILIDEVQFFSDKIIGDILALVQVGKKVYCSGLDLSFDHKPFEITAILMAYADVINKFKAVCSGCGRDAFITAKKGTGNTNTIDVGSADKYVPLCRECYIKNNIGGMVKGE